MREVAELTEVTETVRSTNQDQVILALGRSQLSNFALK